MGYDNARQNKLGERQQGNQAETYKAGETVEREWFFKWDYNDV